MPPNDLRELSRSKESAGAGRPEFWTYCDRASGETTMRHWAADVYALEKTRGGHADPRGRSPIARRAPTGGRGDARPSQSGSP